MKEFLIELGKVLFAIGCARTTNGLPPNEFQYYGIGLFMFSIGCLALGLLFVIGIVELIKFKKKEK